MSLLTSSVGGVFSPEADARWRAEVRDPAGSATPVLATWRQGAAKALSYVAPVPAGWAARIEIHCERDNFVYSGTPWTGPFPYSADAAAWARAEIVARCRRAPEGHPLRGILDLIDGQTSLLDEVEQ